MKAISCFRDTQPFQLVGHVPINRKSHRSCRRGQIAEHKLCQTIILRRLPNLLNFFHGRDLLYSADHPAGRVSSDRKSSAALRPLSGDFEHIVLARDAQPARVSTPRRAWRAPPQTLFSSAEAERIADGRFLALRFQTRKIEHHRAVCTSADLPENLHQLRHIDEPGETACSAGSRHRPAQAPSPSPVRRTWPPTNQSDRDCASSNPLAANSVAW